MHKKKEAFMEKLFYWIRKCICGKKSACRHVCMWCEYYEICKRDGSLE